MFRSALFPLALIILIWAVKALEMLKNYNLFFLGIKPLTAKGLLGIVTSPFIHGDMSHLLANTLPLFLLTWGLFFFYKSISVKIFVFIYLITGFWVWVFARSSYHIGASGLIYGLAGFLIVSGFLRREMRLSAFSLLIVFLYGGLVWGVLPIKAGVSWESHLSGMVAGVMLAYFFKKEGPQRKKYSWEIEEEMEEEKEQQDYENFLEEVEKLKSEINKAKKE